MAEILDARVKQKTGVAADFAGYTLLEGEIALVRTSANGPVWNFKVGPGNFDSLDWSLQNPGAAQKADTSTVFPAGVPGLYIPIEDGTYDGVTVDLSSGYTQLIWDGANLVDVVFPIDLAGYATTTELSVVQEEAESSLGLVSAVTKYDSGISQIPFISIGYLNADGTMTTSANWRTAYKLPCKGGDRLRYYGRRPTNNTNSTMGWYDAEENYHEVWPYGSTTAHYTGQFIFPIDAVAYSACARALDSGDSFNLVLDSILVNADKVEGFKGISSAFSDTIGERPPVLAGYIDVNDDFQANANWLSVVDEPCLGGEVWGYDGVRPQAASLAAVFTKNDLGDITVLIANTSSIQPPYQAQVTTPPDAVSISAVARNQSGDNFSFGKVIKILNDDNIKAVGASKIIKHVEETWKACGTSITYYDGRTYPGSAGPLEGTDVIGFQTLVRRQISFSGYENYGLSGHSLAKNPENSNTITDKMGAWTSARIWSLECPTNDFRLDVVLGDESDYINDTGNTTFYGALRTWYDRVLELAEDGNPYVVVIIDPQRDNSGFDSWSVNGAGHTLEDYNNAMRWFSDRISAPVVDVFKNGGINMDTLGYYTYDGLHPNNEGYKLLAAGLIDVFLNKMAL